MDPLESANTVHTEYLNRYVDTMHKHVHTLSHCHAFQVPTHTPYNVKASMLSFGGERPEDPIKPQLAGKSGPSSSCTTESPQ